MRVVAGAYYGVVVTERWVHRSFSTLVIGNYVC
jgi:hypothetical protein